MPSQHRKGYHKEYMANQRKNTDMQQTALDSEIPVSSAEVDLKRELTRVKEIVRMDIKNIYGEVTSGKLKAASTEALGLYARLLTNMIKEEKDYLDNLSDEELEKLNEQSDQTRKA
jgi:hypothetical protein